MTVDERKAASQTCRGLAGAMAMGCVGDLQRRLGAKKTGDCERETSFPTVHWWYIGA